MPIPSSTRQPRPPGVTPRARCPLSQRPGPCLEPMSLDPERGCRDLPAGAAYRGPDRPSREAAADRWAALAGRGGADEPRLGLRAGQQLGQYGDVALRPFLGVQLTAEVELGVETMNENYFFFPQTKDLLYQNGLSQRLRRRNARDRGRSCEHEEHYPG
jgi:hypothetical protein